MSRVTDTKVGSRRSLLKTLGLILLAALVVLGVTLYLQRPHMPNERISRVHSDISSLLNPLMLYQVMNGFAPSTEQGLQALVSKPTGDPKPRKWTQQLQSVPMDPWGKPYQYEKPGKHNPETFDVFSMGPDGQPHTDDDSGNWNKE